MNRQWCAASMTIKQKGTYKEVPTRLCNWGANEITAIILNKERPITLKVLYLCTHDAYNQFEQHHKPSKGPD